MDTLTLQIRLTIPPEGFRQQFFRFLEPSSVPSKLLSDIVPSPSRLGFCSGLLRSPSDGPTFCPSSPTGASCSKNESSPLCKPLSNYGEL